MTADVQFSAIAWRRATKALWQIALTMACLLFRLSPLAGQQDPGESPGAPGTDEPAASVSENYSGPAVLSRGNQPAITNGQVDTIQPFLNFNRVYGTGLGGGISDTVAYPLQSGIDLGFGLKGTHRWKKMIFQIEYDGNYREYSGQTSATGLNQLLIATAVSQLRRHLVLSIRQTGGILRQDIAGLLLQPSFLDSSSTLPTNEPFSNGIKLIDSVVTLTYQKTRRLSFSETIESSLLRQSMPDVGTNTVALSADVDYRLSGRATIGLDYSFRHFAYTTFGSADVQGPALNYSWRATRSVDIAVQIGMDHSNAVALAVVPIDQQIAALLGEGTSIQVSDRTSNTPRLNARVTKRWRRASANVSYLKGISPGNGLVLASTQESITAGLQYSKANRWTAAVQTGRTTLEGLAAAGSYSQYTIDSSLSRLIRPGLQAVARFDVRPVSYVGTQGLNRTFYLGEIGFVFSPSQIPIALR